MSKIIAVLSTGAIGSCVGADLTRAGHDVVLIDQWPAHVEAMKSLGLHITIQGEEAQIPVRALHLGELDPYRDLFEIVFLTAKSYDTVWIVHYIKPHLKPDGVLVSIQNSLNDEWIAPIIGYQRDVASAIELSAEMYEPGRIKRNTDHSRTWFALGELHGRFTSRLEEIAQILGAVGQTQLTSNIWGAKWTKLTVNSMTQGISGILGMLEWEMVQDPKILEFCVKLGKECLEVGSALGYKVEPIFGLKPEDFVGSSDDVLKNHLTTLLSHVGKSARNSTLQDLMKGRQSEIDFMNGLVVKKGEKAKITTPCNAAVLRLGKQVEDRTLKPDRSNFTSLERLIA
ncbi:MAG: 2-dehydropantoate 2-reductase [Proteobacteria bacterium]|nr:2-dehydropantoate 2-reductase [Pseudomonadota bacterium]